MAEARDVVPAVGGMGEGVELRIKCGGVQFRRRVVRGLVDWERRPRKGGFISWDGECLISNVRIEQQTGGFESESDEMGYIVASFPSGISCPQHVIDNNRSDMVSRQLPANASPIEILDTGHAALLANGPEAPLPIKERLI